ncbi:MAG TPA: hypothetical protein VK504_33470 [Vicinamibacterales bacterium]|nr:hypothetical protein [Vicinamibacterales bacterium]
MDTGNEQRDISPAQRDEERYVSVSYLARFWDVHPNTIYRDIGKGALKAARLPGGQFRIRWIDARRYGRPIE